MLLHRSLAIHATQTLHHPPFPMVLPVLVVGIKFATANRFLSAWELLRTFTNLRRYLPPLTSTINYTRMSCDSLAIAALVLRPVPAHMSESQTPFATILAHTTRHVFSIEAQTLY
jgi:hypothetical protein